MNLTYTLQDITQIAKQVIDTSQNKNLLFYGSMGVGKTTLIKEIAKQLGVKETLTSPTFSIVNEYLLETGKVHHFDFYRIEDENEAYDIGVEEYFDSGNWNLIEWPERIETLLPEDYIKIELTENQNKSRTIKITPVN